MSELRFNVLTDPWIPLDVDGRAQHVSYVELLTGEHDAADLIHPRDDVRFYVRMLLSALTQALFPAKDAKELRKRIAEPLSRTLIEDRIERVKGDFELVGKGAFLQSAETSARENATPQLFFDARHDLFRQAHAYEAICLRCGPVVLYGVHAFATAGGRGYSPGVRGAPPITTLVKLESVRRTSWANTLSEEERIRMAYAQDPPCPWSTAQAEKGGETIGLVEGLFWQPRAVQLVAADEGACCACGESGPRILAAGYAAKSKVAGGNYRHPWSPAWEDTSPKSKRPWSFRNFRSDRPAWTGFSDLVSDSRGSGKRNERLARPAPVVRQWVERLAPGASGASLLVLDYAADKARILGRVSESFPLSNRITDPDFADYVRSLVARAEGTFRQLEDALLSARRKPSPNQKGKGSKAKGYWLPDANAAFWQRTEGPFWSAFDAYLAEDADEDARFADSLRRTAFAIFDEHTSSSASDPQWLAHIVRARRGLAQGLARVLGGHEQGSERKEPADAIA